MSYKVWDCLDHGRVGNRMGYASCWFEGTYSMLHRKAYCVNHGVPLSSISGRVIRHACDNKRCVNPLHLSLGTQADNMADTVGKPASRVKTRVLSDDEVCDIRARKGVTQRELAAEYGVSRMAIQQLRAGTRRGLHYI